MSGAAVDEIEIQEEDNSEFESAFAEFAQGNDDAGEDGGGQGGQAPLADRGASGDDQGGADADAAKKEEDDRDKRIRELEHDLDSQRGRVSGLTKALDKTRQELISVTKPSGNGPEPGDTDDDGEGGWEELKKEFPELAGAIDRKISKIGARLANTEAVVTATVEPLMIKDHQEYIKDQFKKLGEVHSDWADIVKSREYQEWLPTQSEDVRKLVKSQKASDAIFLINGFKAATGKISNGNGGKDEMTEVEKIQAKRRAQLATGAGVQSRKVGRGTASVDHGDYESSFDYFAKKKDKQRADAMGTAPGRRHISW